MKKYVLFIAVLLMVVGTYATASADVNDGQKLFKKYCMKCHGADGSVSEYGRSMKGRQARDLRTNRLFIAPKELLSIIKYGLYGREMKGWQFVLKDDEILDVASFVRTLDYKPNAEAGKKFFDLRCSSCHSEKGAAKTLFKAPDLDMSPLGPVEMGRVIRFGRHGTMMSSKKDLFSNPDVADVVEYLQSIKK
ncbi:MAG: c-type cytochrome [Proteobacteria bacterium]|nr:c-type cytochrome [Pseudomonadota bacterium]